MAPARCPLPNMCRTGRTPTSPTTTHRSFTSSAPTASPTATTSSRRRRSFQPWPPLRKPEPARFRSVKKQGEKIHLPPFVLSNPGDRLTPNNLLRLYPLRRIARIHHHLRLLHNLLLVIVLLI